MLGDGKDDGRRSSDKLIVLGVKTLTVCFTKRNNAFDYIKVINVLIDIHVFFATWCIQ